MSKARLVGSLLAALMVFAACGGSGTGDADSRAAPSQKAELVGESTSITVYSGRSENLVAPLFEKFTQATGIEVKVKYGDTAELAALIQEEAGASPADLFFSQDAGALGALAADDLMVPLPDELLAPVPSQYRSEDDVWVGLSGRARVLVYNTKLVSEEELPKSVLDLEGARWKGRIGWAPTNGSFQAFVTGLRKLQGEDGAKSWLTKVKDDGARTYPKNDAIVLATASGEIHAGLVNHYYLLQLKKQKGALDAQNHFFTKGDPGALVNVAGAGILRTSKAQKSAARLIDYMLSEEGQRYFVDQTFEYPMVASIGAPEGMPSLEELGVPKLDLSDLEDLKGTLDLLKQVGLL